MQEIVHTNGLTKRYGDCFSVNNLDMVVFEEKIYGFLGPNGAGKSTTLKMLLGLVHPTQGEIDLFGKRITAKNRLEALKHIGSLIETPSYYGHLTGKENLKIQQMLLGVPKENIDEVLSIVRLQRQASKKVSAYSLGMKQRLGLASALLSFPRLLIFDEPTNGLDPAGIQEMRELILSPAGKVWHDGDCVKPPSIRNRPDGGGYWYYCGRKTKISGQFICPAQHGQNKKFGRNFLRTYRKRGKLMISLLKTEHKKTKKKYLLLTSLLITALDLAWIFYGNFSEDAILKGWMMFLYQLPLTNAIFLPFLMTVVASRLADIEHRGFMLKQLCTIVPRGKLFDAKLLYGFSIVLACMVIQFVSVFIFGCVKGFGGVYPFRLYSIYWLFTIAASLAIYIFQHTLSMLFQNQAVPFFAGVIGEFLECFPCFCPSCRVCANRFYGVITVCCSLWEAIGTENANSHLLSL